MDSIKKNWIKLAVAVVLIVAFVFALINVINAMGINSGKMSELIGDGGKSAANSALFGQMGIAVALLGAAVALTLAALEKGGKAVSFIFIGAGAVALILIVISMFVGTDGLKLLETSMKGAELLGKDSAPYKMAAYSYYEAIYRTIVNIIIFGLVPVFYGLKGLLAKK